METITNISNLIEAYVDRGDKEDINSLLKAQDLLSGYSFHLAQIVGDAKGTYNNLLFTRKITINRQMQSLLNAKISKAAAQVQAESSAIGEEMIKAELDAEADAYRADLLLNQVNKILSSMAQRISFMKQEYESTKRHV